MNILLVLLIFIIQVNAISINLRKRREPTVEEILKQQEETRKTMNIVFPILILSLLLFFTIYMLWVIIGFISWCLETQKQKEEREKMEKRKELEEEKINL